MNTLDLVFDWLLQSSFRASLLTMAVLLIQRALSRHLSARWNYVLWLPVLIVLLMPALLESRWSAESLLVVAEPTRQVLPEVPVVFATTSPTPVSASPEKMIQLRWQHVWLIGALGLLITGVTSFMLTLRRFRKNACSSEDGLVAEVAILAEEIGLRRVPRVCVSSAISSPAVAGLFRPILLLPLGFREAFTTHEARLVLKHELMHLKRGDLSMNALLCVLMALHWFNPLLWLAFYKARINREAACDEDVLCNDSPADRAAYGHALLKAESSFCPRGWSLGFVGIFDRGAGLRMRIRSIAEARHTPGKMAVLALGLMAILTFLGTTRAQVAVEKQAEEEFVSLEIMILELSGQSGDFSGQIKTFFESREHSQVLSAADENELRRQIAKSQDSKIIAYPRILTRLGQEASIRSVVNQPVPDEKQKSGISYMPIGLIFYLLPSRSGDKIQLKYDLTDSRMIGEEQTPKGPMPIVKSYRNQSSVELEEGHTLALWNQEERKLYAVRLALVSGPEELPANSPGSSPKEPEPSKAKSESPERGQLTKKLQNIVLPRVQFSGATLEEAIEFFRVKSRALDTSEPEVSKRGVNIVLKDSFSVMITLDLREVPLMEALKYTASLSGLELQIDDKAVILKKSSANSAAKPAPASQGKAVEMAKKYILPQVQFSGATLKEAVEFLRANYRDREEAPTPWINLILKPGGNPTAQISLDLKDVSLWEALRYTAELSNHTLSADDHGIILTPR